MVIAMNTKHKVFLTIEQIIQNIKDKYIYKHKKQIKSSIQNYSLFLINIINNYTYKIKYYSN